MPGAVAVRGIRELQGALRRADKQTRTLVRDELRRVAEPVRRDAETLARSQIRQMPLSPRWAKMRVGVTGKVVYVAPVARGVRSRGHPLSRPNLAELLKERALEPALDRHRAGIEAGIERALDRIADGLNRGR